jgi:peptidoglycan-associated lipoprotein
MKNLAMILVAAAALAGCASKETQSDAPVTDRSAGTSQPQASTGAGTMTRPSAQTGVAGNPLKDPSNILSKRSVFFDYDSMSLKEEYRPLVQAHSRYLGDKRDSRVRIEGNCDERGSREYNLALGQRRAESVKKVMTALGVSDGRIETISYGEEKPMAQGHDESAYSQNRRADIKYAGE